MNAPERQREERRAGPRPLALHLTTAGTTLMSAVAGLPAALSGIVPWHPDLAKRAEALLDELRQHDPSALSAAVMEETFRRMQATVDGIDRYQTHGYRRDPTHPPTIWYQGAARLLDYGGDGPPTLFVPSLVNRAYILDLDEETSLLRQLAREGVARPLLLDWGSPSAVERDFDVGCYVTGPLSSAIDQAVELAAGPVPIVGYCMGGTLAIAAACHRPERISGLGLLASPWDFHADLSEPARAFIAAAPLWRPVLQAFGEMPVDLIQAFFAALDPNLALRKFQRFAEMNPASEAARRFVALEDWLNDGVPLTYRVADECLTGWYGENRTARGEWRVNGTVVDPARIECPAFVAIPANDRIVPPASALGAARALPNATVVEPRAGHIGMVVGSRAARALWAPLSAWLARLDQAA